MVICLQLTPNAYRNAKRKARNRRFLATVCLHIHQESDQSSANPHEDDHMTACIVGLAHSPFGKLDAETI